MAYVLGNLLTARIRCPKRKWIYGNVSEQHSSAVIHSAAHNLSHTLIPRVLASRWGWPGMLGIYCEVAAQKSTVLCFTNKYVREVQQRRQKKFKHFLFMAIYTGHLSQQKIFIWSEYVKLDLLINLSALFNWIFIQNTVLFLFMKMRKSHILDKYTKCPVTLLFAETQYLKTCIFILSLLPCKILLIAHDFNNYLNKRDTSNYLYYLYQIFGFIIHGLDQWIKWRA